MDNRTEETTAAELRKGDVLVRTEHHDRVKVQLVTLLDDQVLIWHSDTHVLVAAPDARVRIESRNGGA